MGGKVLPRAARNGGLVPAAASPRPAAERVRAAEGPAVMKFSIVHDSRRGMRRVNEDRVGHWESPGALLMAVADGLGGDPPRGNAPPPAGEGLRAAVSLAAPPQP